MGLKEVVVSTQAYTKGMISIINSSVKATLENKSPNKNKKFQGEEKSIE
jgi:hypothetical protein